METEVVFVMTVYQKTKRRTYEILCKAEEGDLASKVVDWIIVLLVLLTAVTVVLGSYQDIEQRYHGIFHLLEVIIIVSFTTEYLLRLWTADLLYPEAKHPRLKYIFSMMAIIDLAAVLPFWLPFLSVDFRVLHLLRIFHALRLLSVFKLGRYFDAFEMIVRVLRKTKTQLVMFLFLLCFSVLFSAIILFLIENPAQPDAFPNVVSTLSWAVSVLTAGGSSAVHPVTAMGRMIENLFSIVGVVMVAIPSGILAAGFVTEMTEKNDSEEEPENLKEEIREIREKLDLVLQERDDLIKIMEDCRHINATQDQVTQSVTGETKGADHTLDDKNQSERKE